MVAVRQFSGDDEIQDVDLVIDALIGYSLDGPSRGATASLIRAVNDTGTPCLSLDTPSGIDLASGRVYEPAIKADATLTLALPKHGLRSNGAQPLVGELWLADIGVPPALYAEPSIGLQVRSPFEGDDIVRIA